MAALQTTEAVVPGANLSQVTTLRTSRVTVYTVKSRGREGDLPPEAKKKIEKR